MLKARINQIYLYLFKTYKSSYNKEVREILSKKEFEIFDSMSNYDKLHSYNLLKKVQKSSLLSGNIIYKKLALLHDCGKLNTSLFRRIKNVLIGDKILEQHPQKSFELLKDSNRKLANLALNHHKKTEDIYMKEFQKLDNG